MKLLMTLSVKKFSYAILLMCVAAAHKGYASSNAHPCSGPALEASEAACTSYIMGFLEGALQTDAAILENIEGSDSGFLERVYKTRGHRFGQSPPATYLARFCLPEPLDLNKVSADIIDYLKGQQVSAAGVNAVYLASKKLFPCD